MAEDEYEAPTITELGRVEEFTQTIAKHRSMTSDGYTYDGFDINS